MREPDNKLEETGGEKPAGKKKISKKWLTFAFVLINIAALAYAVVGDLSDPKEFSFSLLGEMLSRNWYYLVFALLSLILSLILRALVFYVMLRTVSKEASFAKCISVSVLGKYYDNITPFGTGGQPFQIMYLRKNGIEKGDAFSLPIAEYSFHRFSFLLLSFAAIALNFIDVFQTRGLVKSAMLVTAIVGALISFILPLFCVLFSFSRAFCSRIIKFVVGLLKLLRITKEPEVMYSKIMLHLEQYSNSINKIASKITIIIFCFAISIAANLALCSIAFFSLKTFDYSLNSNIFLEWAHVVILSLFVYNSVTFIPTPGNSGAADLSFYWLFNSMLAGATAVAMISWRILSYYIYILLGLVFIVYDFNVKRRAVLRKVRRQKEEESP